MAGSDEKAEANTRLFNSNQLGEKGGAQCCRSWTAAKKGHQKVHVW